MKLRYIFFILSVLCLFKSGKPSVTVAISGLLKARGILKELLGFTTLFGGSKCLKIHNHNWDYAVDSIVLQDLAERIEAGLKSGNVNLDKVQN